jgi:GNAT superfamily N-acetyltransferase
MTNVEILRVNNRKQRKAFIDFPYRLYRHDPNWVPQFRLEQSEFLNPRKHPFYEHGEIIPMLALDQGKVVGRIAAIINGNHNRYHSEQTGFFGFYECIEDQRVSDALLRTAENELRKRGCREMLGPANPSLHDIAGLLTAGFDRPPMVMMPYNPRYYLSLLKGYGMEKRHGMFAYLLDTKKAIIPAKLASVKTALEKRGFRLRHIDMGNFASESKHIERLYADAWGDNWGFVPMSEREFDHTATMLKLIANPDYVYFVEKDGEPVGFSVALPNINSILIDNRGGYLRPDIIYRLLRNKRKVSYIRILLLGAAKRYQRLGLGAMMYIQYIEEARRRGLGGAEMSWVLESNKEMVKAAEILGGVRYKTYEMVGKTIENNSEME